MLHREQTLQPKGKVNMLKALLLAGVGTLALVSVANACDAPTSTASTGAAPVSGTTYSLSDGSKVTLNSDNSITLVAGGETVTLPAGSAMIAMNGDGTVSLNGPASANTSAAATQAAAQTPADTSGSNTSAAVQTASSPSPASASSATAASPAQTTTDPATAQTASDPSTASQATTDPASAQTATDPSTTASTTAKTGTVSQASGGMRLIGVNISGGEFGSGQVGTNYIYPSDAELSFYASAGMTVIRVPFLIENVMPNPGTLSSADVSALKHVVTQAASVGMDVDLDAHNYGKAWGNLITPGSQTEQQFDNFWQEMAQAFAGYPNVIFGIMNEPNQQTPQQQATIDNDAIQAIRNAGATQEILVPGTSWTGAWTWVSGGNAAAINPSTIQDPDNNWVIEVHQYLDADGSGTNPAPITDPNVGVSRLTAITQWAQQVGAKLFLGEFGAPQDSQSQQVVANMLSYMEQNSNVWQGGTMWGAGAWWGNYFQGIEPAGLTGTTPGLATLEQFVPKKPGA